MPLGTPVEGRKLALFKPIPGLRGLKIRLLHQRGQDVHANKARKLLARHGAMIEVTMAEHGWHEFGGRMMLFSSGIEAEAEAIRTLLRRLGYLDQPRQERDDPEVDVVLWLEATD